MSRTCKDESLRGKKHIGTVSPLEFNEAKDEISKANEVGDGDEGAGGVKPEEEEGEEARKVQGYRAVKKPSAQYMEEHRKTHMPYDPACPDCVRGRGLGQRHGQKADRQEEIRVPTIAADYCSLGDSETEKNLTVLVARGSKSGSTCAPW